jgi:PAS domain S-box-containing protein
MGTEREAVVQQAPIAGGGEMGALICSHDWSQTLLGPSQTWSYGLKTTLSILLNACSPMFLLWGGDRILLYNDAYSSILKQGKHQVPLGQSVKDCWTGDWDSIRSDVEQVFTTGQPLRRENERFPLPMHDNSRGHCYTWSYSAIWDETGQVSGVFATGCRVITEETRNTRTSEEEQHALSGQNLQDIEETLQSREEQLRLITNAVPVLIAYLDQDHCYRFVNQTYEVWFEQRATEVIGKHVREVLGEPAYEAVRYYMEQALSGQRVSFESQIPYRDGGTRYVRADYVPHINSQGDVEGYIGLVSDISDVYRQATQRKQAEAALRESEERARLAIKVGRLGTWRYDPSIDCIELDERMREIWGEPEDVVIMPLSRAMERIHPDDRALVASAVGAALDPQSSGTYEIDYRIVWDDGSERWVSANGQAQFDGEGAVRRPVGFLGTALDITERKQAEEALRQIQENLKIANERFEVAATAVNCLIYDWDLERDRVERTEGLTRILGYSLTEAEPTGAWWRERIHPDDLQRIQKEAAITVMTSDRQCYEYRICHKNNQYIYVLDQGLVVSRDAQGKPTRIIGSTTDITDAYRQATQRKQAEAALRQSEERYRCLAELIPQLVWTANAEGILLDVNQRWVDFTGLRLAEARIEGWQAIVHPDDVPTLGQQWASAQQNGTYYQAEGRIRRTDGVYRWHLHQAVPLKNEGGQVIKWFGTATDIEDQKQLEQQRDRILQQEQAAREEAERANRIKDEFLAVLSHELRSPLNPILGWAKLLQGRKLDEQTTQRALETIERNAKLQTQLIEDLLDVSRILRGKMALDVRPVKLVTVIQAAIETMRLAAEAKQITIQTLLTSDVGQVSGDAARLQQIVWNLLSNAVKFTPTGGRIEVRLERMGNQAQIQVKDTGKGIKPEFLPHVFEYFRQEDGTTTRQFGGLGLGLAIVRHLCELHGGTVRVESSGEGLGATFTVSIPLLTQASKRPLDIKSNTNTISLSGVRILLVDDDADMRDFAKFLLEQYEAEVNTVASAPEALAVFDQFKPDVLISDIGMPAMDGYMLMHQVRKRSPKQGGQIPAIALTAYAGQCDQQQALAAGFQQHVAKPVEPEELVKAIVKLFGNDK